jgi:serine/threonine protein kinase
MPKRKFTFASNDPDGDIRISLLRNNLPPLPALPNSPSDITHDAARHQKEKVVLARLTVPVSLAELKNVKHVDRWYKIDIDGCEASGEVAQVRIALDFNYRPSRIVNSADSLNQKYNIEDTIGTGVSVVKKAVNKCTKKEYAVKFLQKQVKGQTIPRSSLDNEIELLKTISHPNIVQLYESMEDNSTIYLVMELIKGCDLYDISDILGTLRPTSVSALILQLLSALNYLHSRGIVHHDIKPENIILDYQKNTVKLTDFGSAKMVNRTDEGAVGGTLNYMAPEVLMNMRGARNVCATPVDVWSIGIITYMLISGLHPFDSGKTTQNIINRIIKGKYEFPSPIWDKVPKECKDFIKRCLVFDPKKRATVSELLKHPFVTKQSNVNIFSEEECERIEREKSSRSSSRSTSMGSLLELFSSAGVSRS